MHVGSQQQKEKVGSKDWRVIRELADKVDLDWVMLANSLTVHRQAAEDRLVAHVLAGVVGKAHSYAGLG